MRVIYEQDIERTDFIEIRLDPDEIHNLSWKPVVKEFVFGKKTLNIFIYKEEDDYAID
jgi:hypothetical protein